MFDVTLSIAEGNRYNGKMEEDVKPKDEDGVDGRGVCGWDGWVCDFDTLNCEHVRVKS